jgi:thioredoxin 1
MHGVIDVDAGSWDREVLQSDTLVVVDFWHERCPWCIRLNPVYNEVSEEYGNRVKFVKLNVLKSHENQHIAVKYGIMGTPTLVFFCYRRPVEMIAGFQSKERLKQFVDDVFNRWKNKELECFSTLEERVEKT